MKLSHKTRDSHLSRLRKEKFDLLVLGGGINGVGVAHDAASRGLKVALIESSDFSSGTSSRSTKLAHGGLRYLETFEFNLVFESLRERAFLLKTSPHLVKSLDFIFPVFKDDRVPSWKLKLGIFTYDLLSGLKSNYHKISTHQVLANFPLLKKEGLRMGLCYKDARMEDALLNFEVLRAASKEGAVCVNYIKALKCESQKVLAKNLLTQEEFEIQCDKVVSTLGPWTDLFFKKNKNNWQNLLTTTKGVHLVFKEKDLPAKKALVIQDGKRIIFVIPTLFERVLVGTTDTEYSGDPSEVVVTRSDVEYIFKALKNYFPDFKPSYDKIISSYAGVRPLANQSEKNLSQISRKGRVIEKEGIYLAFGGKYTSFRTLSKQVVDKITDKKYLLSRRPINPQALSPVTKLKSFTSTYVEFFKSMFAGESEKIVEEYFPVEENLKQSERYWAILARRAIHETMCLHLKDFFQLRTALVLLAPDKIPSLLPLISSIFQKELSWSDQEKRRQVDEVLNCLTFPES